MTDHDAADWRTPAERDEYRSTPDYAATLAYLDRLVRAFPQHLRIEAFGTTGEGRELKVVVASQDGTFDPGAAHRDGRAVLLVQNAIHAGEMDGKDACLALLRDLVRDPSRLPLLDRVVLVVIPVYNVDGHERRSPYGRINQRGPREMGWRANATNLNLNRDYLKARAPETRALLRLIQRWRPDFFVDNHVTDGADFQYDVTFQLDDTPDVAPGTSAWIRDRVTPELVRHVDASGHLAFPRAVFLRDDTDPARGIAFNENPPRFSTGYMILENRPGLLVELHMLKEYRTRVTANYEVLRGLLAILNREATELIALNRAADEAASRLPDLARTGAAFPLMVGPSGETSPVRFRGIAFTRRTSDVSGAPTIEYGTEPWDTTMPVETGVRVVSAIVPPAGYIVPPEWVDVLDVLAAHGVRIRHTTAAWTGSVGRYRCGGMAWASRPFEGRHPILRAGNVEGAYGRFGSCVLSTEILEFPAGSAVVPLDQRLSKVAIHWLEPEAPDSAVRWGFFDSIFEQKEYGEAYVVERYGRDELARDPALKAEFEARLRSDPEFAADPDARLAFFYDRSPWYRAQRIGEYPVGRLATLDGLPTD